MDHNVNPFHECGARLTTGRVCHTMVRAPKRFCGTHLKQYNLHTAFGQHPELWDALQQQLLETSDRRLLNWANRHPVLSRFPNMPVNERVDRYNTHNFLFRTVNRHLEALTGYFFPIETLHILVINNLPDPLRTFLNRIAGRVNAAIASLWFHNADIFPEIQDIARDIQENVPRQPVGELAQFAHDNQNVHKTVTVNMVKEVVDRVLKIPVPPEYAYTNGNRTAGEVLAYVPMNPATAAWFVQKYMAREDIYEYGPGIYSKVMDSVWQYVLGSSAKEDLYKILSVELIDSVGMCAQGNLTRICNVLAGYLEGVNTESQGEQLQRRMAKLMELETPEDRIREGKKILEELAVPTGEHDAWIEALS